MQGIYAIAFLYIWLAGQWFVGRLVRALRFALTLEPAEDWQRCENVTSGIIGTIERTLVLVSLILHMPVAILVWLTVKTAGGAAAWWADHPSRAEQDDNAPEHLTVRQQFSIYLIGTGLSVLFALAAWLFCKWTADWMSAIDPSPAGWLYLAGELAALPLLCLIFRWTL